MMRGFRRHFFVCCIPLSLLVLNTLANAKPSETPVTCQVSNEVVDVKGQSEFFAGLLNTESWPARWNCGIWTPFHGWLYILSDFMIWLAYFMIPLILGYYLYKKQDGIPFKFIFLLFIAFILFCGLTHFIDAVIFWWPVYRLSALVRFITAMVSMGTVFALVKVTPEVLKYKSPEALEKLVSELTALNRRLKDEILQRERAENELKRLNEDLEKKVDERTQDLKASNSILKRTNELFQSAQEAGKIGVWQMNVQEGSIYCSEEVYRILELTSITDFNFEKALSFIQRDHRDKVREAISIAERTCESYDLEVKLLTANRNNVWVRIVGLPVVEDSKMVSLRGLLMDIDLAKTSQENMAASKRVLSMALEAGEIGAWNWNIKTGALQWDDYMHKLMDHPKRDFRGIIQDFTERIHPDDMDLVSDAIGDTIRKDIKYDIVYRVIASDGKTRILHSKGEVTKDEYGDPVAMIGICMNITDQKLHEQNLKESEQRFKATVDYSPIGVALMGTDSMLLKVNNALTEMLGYNEAGLLRLGLYKITYPEDRELDKEHLKKLQKGDVHSYQLDKRYLNTKGVPVWVQQNVSAVRDANGNTRYFIIQIMDITERKMAEKRIHEVVRQRTAQLEATNQELEAFSYSVSHDLRSPLRSIHGFSQALMEDYSGQLDDIGQDYLNRVSSASVRMGRLIDDLLALSRISRQEIRFEPVDVSALASHVAENLAADEYTKTEFIIAPGLSALADKGLLTVALENLFENAAKYSRKSTSPKVEFGDETIDNKQVFYIKDNGVGFDMNYADKLFGAFQRLHGDKEFEGTGIGLATVKRIIHRHGGEIWAQSAIDNGATFYFTLN
ncbi:PAS domain-containing protein [Fulvivirga ulvae]|uniref:PAS domain-containing protein n=1 Tax=Fulvivirga ulvae TaxID=2904245 RepID=UPI003F8F41A9